MVLDVVLPKEIISSGVSISRVNDASYAAACDFTAQQYNDRFCCELTGFYPTILTSIEENEIQSVVGLRGAEDEPLFLEQYLDTSIEATLHEKSGISPTRREIVEIGGFAARNQKSALALMQEMTEILIPMRFRFAVCTANRPIRCCLTKLRLPKHRIVEVDNPSVETQKNWGSYYETHPTIIYTQLDRCAAAIDRIRGVSA